MRLKRLEELAAGSEGASTFNPETTVPVSTGCAPGIGLEPLAGRRVAPGEGAGVRKSVLGPSAVAATSSARADPNDPNNSNDSNGFCGVPYN